jgi:hypothetical protein
MNLDRARTIIDESILKMLSDSVKVLKDRLYDNLRQSRPP